jgi:SagB-type dehydrogenase family enzyme
VLPRPDPYLPAHAAALVELVAARRSRRVFGARALAAAEVGALLWAGQGITSSDGRRAAPSAGNLHPITLTLLDARGVWRYLPGEHTLARVGEGDHRLRLSWASHDQECVALAPAVVAVSAEPGILAGRYTARSKRYCALEAGHVAQNVLLMAAALGLEAVPVAAFDDRAVREVLGLGAGHLPLYLVPVGARPGHRGGG